MQKIVEETNNYRQQNVAPNVEKNCSLVPYECERIVYRFRQYNIDGIGSKELHKRLLING